MQPSTSMEPYEPRDSLPRALTFTPAEWRYLLEDPFFLSQPDNSFGAPRRWMGLPVTIVQDHQGEFHQGEFSGVAGHGPRRERTGNTSSRPAVPRSFRPPCRETAAAARVGAPAIRRAVLLLVSALVGIGAWANPSSVRSAASSENERPHASGSTFPSGRSPGAEFEQVELAQTKTVACDPAMGKDGGAQPIGQVRCEMEFMLGEDGTRRTAVSVVRPTGDGGLVVLRASWIEEPPSMPAARKLLVALNGLPSHTLWLAGRLLWWRHS
jgi:hypothetical protein